jgi:undecaprenyl-diphosphatase
MDLWHAIVMGIVQGLGEFLPISSSGHLVILPWLFDFPTPGLTFDVALHFGTLLALLAFFYRDWLQLVPAFFSSLKKKPTLYNPEERLIWFILIGSIPAAIAGLLVEEYAETIFRNPLWVGFNMAFFGLLLYLTDRWGKKTKGMGTMNLTDAVLIGLAQCLALIPGTSRSGVTITAAMGRDMDRVAAARFSFLLSTPVIAGAAILKAPDFFRGVIDIPSLVGIFFSFVVGYLSIKYMLHFLQRYSFLVYILYRMAFALVVFTAYWFKYHRG